MPRTEYINQYLQKLHSGLAMLDVVTLGKIIDLLSEARDKKQQVFVLGNGGSSATASHFVNDLNKMASSDELGYFKAISLADNMPLITAWANDTSYENVFSMQMRNLQQKDDVLVVISASGNSPNVIKAIADAKKAGLVTLGLLGFDGGKAKALLDHSVTFPEFHYGRAEDAHHICCHIIATNLSIKE